MLGHVKSGIAHILLLVYLLYMLLKNLKIIINE